MKGVALQLLATDSMPNDLEQFLKELFGEPVGRLMQFQTDQMQRLQTKLAELSREAVKDEMTKLHNEIAELRNRVATLEAERAQTAADSIQSSF
jgi:phage shock protein A